jgi:hypothetical protein
LQAVTVAAIMQPYFAPFAGYYRLLAAADIFVIYDCVQFPRRGWVHRNRLRDAQGEPRWLTLPLSSAPYEARIEELAFAPNAQDALAERARAFPQISKSAAEDLRSAGVMDGSLVDYLEGQLRYVRDVMGFPCEIVRSSALGIDPILRAQDRVLAILDALDAEDYVNAPGGRDLYDEKVFKKRRKMLHFLPDYQGPAWSILQRLIDEPAESLRAEILAQTPVYDA